MINHNYYIRIQKVLFCLTKSMIVTERKWTHPLQELNDSVLVVWLCSGQLVKPELKFIPGVLKHPAVF